MCNNHTWVTKTGIDRTAEEECKDKHVWVCVCVHAVYVYVCACVWCVCPCMWYVCVKHGARNGVVEVWL